MGDRGNIVIKQPKGNFLYFYTHWSGSDIPKIVQDALKRGKDRWDDQQYLSRVIFCELIKDDLNGTDGYGISTYMGDNEHDFIVVDIDAQTINVVKEGDPGAEPKKSWKFKKFVELSIDKEFGYGEDE